tara:strand:- start:1509 stop:2171 length:663 start_codon:yes stop_codon:yes gene_type:complete
MESKKNIVLLLIISVLYSCSTVPMNTQTYKLVYAGIFGYEDIDLDSSYIEQLPYSSMKVKIGKGPGGLAILESMNEDKETWVTSDEIFLIIKGGRIIGSYGLVETNLVDYQSKDPNFKLFIDSKQKEFTSYRVLSYDNPEALNVRFKVITTYKGVEQITILNYARELVLIEETIQNDYLNWKTTNKFWVDKDSGFVWKSIQTYAPNLPNFKLEVTKRPPL